MLQNYPNPFNPETKITFHMKASSRIVLKVYNLLGYEVATVTDETYQAGSHEVMFDASQLPSGVYMYRIQMGDYKAVRKMMLLE